MTGVVFYPLLCIIGGIGYCFLEILWRGYTHWSMAAAGAISLVFMGFLCLNFPQIPIIFKSMISAIFITAVELVFGIVFNLILKLNVWNYSGEKYNFLGQICPQYTFLWFLLSFFIIILLEKIIN